MSPERFDHLLALVKSLIEKKNTNLQKSIPAEERLALIFYFLVTDHSQSLCFSYRIGKATAIKKSLKLAKQYILF